MSYGFNRGLGAAGAILAGSVIDTGFGTSADCSQLGPWLLNSSCWTNSLSQWKALAAGQFPLPPAPAVPPAPTQAQLDAVAASPDPGAAASDLVQTLTDQAVTGSQSSLSVFFSNIPGTAPGSSPINWWLVGGLGFVGLLLFRSSGSRR